MAVKQIVFGGDSAAKVQTVTMDGIDYQLRVRWSDAAGAWYMDLYDADGQPLQVGRRLSASYAPILGLRGPPGCFIVDGKDGEPAEALGSTFNRYYVEAT